MTFEILTKLFLEKNPNGEINKHGTVFGCDVAVKFNNKSKVYNYKGNYAEIAKKLKLVEIKLVNYKGKMITEEVYQLKSREEKILNMFPENNDFFIFD